MENVLIRFLDTVWIQKNPFPHLIRERRKAEVFKSREITWYHKQSFGGNGFCPLQKEGVIAEVSLNEYTIRWNHT